MQSSEYRDDVFKLITLNTPHYGSQMANLLFDENASPAVRDWICNVLNYQGLGDCYGGAIADLRVDSDAINMELNSANIQYMIPSHAIVSTYNASNDWYIVATVSALGVTNYNQLFNNESNDIVVAVSSQKGGIDMFEAFAVSSFEDISHQGSYNHIEIQSKVKELLLASASNSKFTNQGFAANSLEYNSPVISTGGLVPLNIDFNSPQNGETISYGEIITIEATSDYNPEKIALIIGDFPMTEASRILFDGNHFEHEYHVTPGKLGPMKLGVMTAQQGVGLGTNHIIVNITTDQIPESITNDNGGAVVEVGKTATVYFEGHFTELGDIIVSFDPSVEFIFEHGYAEHIGNGVIRGLTSGTDTLRVIFNGVESEPMRVLVLDEDEITETTIIRPETTQLGSLDIFPNPSSGPMTMRFVAEDNGERIISIFDVSGREVNRLRVKANQGENLVDFSTNNLAKGIYFVRVNGEKQGLVEKFIRM